MAESNGLLTHRRLGLPWTHWGKKRAAQARAVWQKPVRPVGWLWRYPSSSSALGLRFSRFKVDRPGRQSKSKVHYLLRTLLYSIQSGATCRANERADIIQ
jgi:hypothetical protein